MRKRRKDPFTGQMLVYEEELPRDNYSDSKATSVKLQQPRRTK